MTCHHCGIRIPKAKDKNGPERNWWSISTKDGVKTYCVKPECREKAKET